MSAPVQFVHEVTLGAPPPEVFAFVSDFERLPEWMPLMRRVDVDDSDAVTPGGVGAVRRIHGPVGGPTLETVRTFEPPHKLAYSATDASLRGMFTRHLGVLELAPHDGGTRLTWTTHARPGRNPIMRWVGRRVFRYVLDRSVAALAARFPTDPV